MIQDLTGALKADTTKRKEIAATVRLRSAPQAVPVRRAISCEGAVFSLDRGLSTGNPLAAQRVSRPDGRRY
jgi:hypothetical protein